MQITDIEKLGKGRSRIYIDGQPAFILYKSEMLRYQMDIGTEISEELYEEIKQTILQKRAKLRCMNLLKTRDRTEYQLRTKLKQGEYPADVIDEAVAYVKSYRYVDDERYARQYIEYRKDQKSRMQLIQELSQKGINKDIVRQAMDELEFEGEEVLIRRLIEKKNIDLNQAGQAEVQKLYRFLLRKGFSSSDISRVIRTKDNPDEP